jgi:hypothetical protein
VTDDDTRLLNELRDLVERIDPVPEGVKHAARGSFTWRTIDAELAQLAYDSAVDEALLASVRSSSTSRLLTFETPSLTIELELEPQGATSRVRGQLAPPQTAQVAVRHAGGTAQAEADQIGCFTAEGIAHGPLSLRCELADGAVVVTEWLAQ